MRFHLSVNPLLAPIKGENWSDIPIADWGLRIADCGLNQPVVQRSLVPPLTTMVSIGLLVLGAGPTALGTPDPALTRLFTPRAVPAGTYVVYRSAEPIEALTARLKDLDPNPSPGAWEPSRPEAHTAFGADGIYDMLRLARLFTGKRVTLVRGSLLHERRRLAYTLISPYPDPSLSTVESGTMVIEFAVPYVTRNP